MSRRMSVFAAALCAAVCLSLVANQVAGKEKQKPAAAKKPVVAAKKVVAEKKVAASDPQAKVRAEQRIKAVLETPTSFDFVETQLNDVVAYLQDNHKIPIKLDTKALSDEGMGRDTPVTFSVKGVSLRSGLNQMLDGLDLDYVVRNEMLLITTQTMAKEILDIKLYDVTDLTGDSPADLKAIAGTIKTCVQPDSWSDVGGVGSIVELRLVGKNMLVVSQTQRVHDEISDLMAKLRATVEK